jgi:ABC-type multidrug transport system fused ATPase/permease subunit
LDNSTEKALMETIKEIQGHKTILMIAHRLSTIQSCSNILVFDDGVLIDQGTYKDLMDRCAKFQAMARLS